MTPLETQLYEALWDCGDEILKRKLKVSKTVVQRAYAACEAYRAAAGGQPIKRMTNDHKTERPS